MKKILCAVFIIVMIFSLSACDFLNSTQIEREVFEYKLTMAGSWIEADYTVIAKAVDTYYISADECNLDLYSYWMSSADIDIVSEIIQSRQLDSTQFKKLENGKTEISGYKVEQYIYKTEQIYTIIFDGANFGVCVFDYDTENGFADSEKVDMAINAITKITPNNTRMFSTKFPYEIDMGKEMYGFKDMVGGIKNWYTLKDNNYLEMGFLMEEKDGRSLDEYIALFKKDTWEEIEGNNFADFTTKTFSEKSEVYIYNVVFVETEEHFAVVGAYSHDPALTAGVSENLKTAAENFTVYKNYKKD